MENEQELKNDLIEQIENFEYEGRRLYDEHILFTKLNILKIEVESEYVTLENLKLYSEILCELIKNFNGSKIEELNPKIKKELQKLEEKAKIIQEIEKNKKPIEITEKEKTSEKESLSELDELNLFRAGAVGLFLAGGIGYIAVNIMAVSLGVSIAAAAGILLGGIIGAVIAIGVVVWGISKAVRAFMNWRKNKNLSKVLQKTQEIAEKIPEISQEKQIGQEEKNIETINQDKTLVLYIKNDLLIQIEKLKSEVFRKDNGELTQELNALEDNINKSNSLDGLKEINKELLKFAKKIVKRRKLSEIKNFTVEISNKIRYTENKIRYTENKLKQKQSEQQQQNRDKYQNVISQVRKQNNPNKTTKSMKKPNSKIKKNKTQNEI